MAQRISGASIYRLSYNNQSSTHLLHAWHQHHSQRPAASSPLYLALPPPGDNGVTHWVLGKSKAESNLTYPYNCTIIKLALTCIKHTQTSTRTHARTHTHAHTRKERHQAQPKHTLPFHTCLQSAMKADVMVPSKSMHTKRTALSGCCRCQMGHWYSNVCDNSKNWFAWK